MRTVYCPKSHEELARASAGKEFGHAPGHEYHDVDAILTVRGDRYRCQIVETWGSARGYDEEHGRREVVGRGITINEAISQAMQRARSAGIEEGYMQTAASRLEDSVEE